MRRLHFLAGGVLCCANVLALASPVGAQTIIDWINSSGGSYGSGSNWTGFNVPNNTSESARFNLLATYNVTLNSGVTTTVSDLLVNAGDVTLAANASVFTIYNIDDDVMVNGGNLTLSDAGGSGDVRLSAADQFQVTGGSTLNVLTGSDVDAVFLFVGTSSGDGTVVVDGSGSTFDATGSVDISLSNTSGSLT